MVQVVLFVIVPFMVVLFMAVLPVIVQGEGCQPWCKSSDGESLHSGSNKGYGKIKSVLAITKDFTREEGSNYVEFQYRVDAELCKSNYGACDGLTFFIDSERMLPHSDAEYKVLNQQLDFQTISFNLTQGPHTLQWVYSKDYYEDQGEDRAELKHLVLAGAEGSAECGRSDSSTCKVCPSGTYGDGEGMSKCTRCPWGTFNEGTGSRRKADCKHCAEGTISVPGSHSCTALPNCTQSDLVYKVEPLDTCTTQTVDGFTGLHRDVNPELTWIANPDKGNEEHIQLCRQSDTFELSNYSYTAQCGCNTGQRLNPATKTCENCKGGTFNDGSVNKSEVCEACPVGERSIGGTYVNMWSDDVSIADDKDTIDYMFANEGVCKEGVGADADGMCTGCIGSGCQKDRKGWVASYDHVSSGRTVGDVDKVFSWQGIPVKPGSSIVVNCSVDCRRSSSGNKEARDEVCSLRIQLINGTSTPSSDLGFDCGVGMDPDPRYSWYSSTRKYA